MFEVPTKEATVERLSADEFANWWGEVLRRDEKEAKNGETYEAAYARYLRCVFCDRPLSNAIREALEEENTTAAMLGYWANIDPPHKIVAAGASPTPDAWLGCSTCTRSICAEREPSVPSRPGCSTTRAGMGMRCDAWS